MSALLRFRFPHASLRSARRTASRLLLTFALVLTPSVAFAASVRGAVSDPDGRPTPGAQVLVAGPVGIAATTTTDARGRFVFDALNAGRYELRVALDGFRADPVRVDLAADDTREVAIQLRLSAVSESIVVSAAQVDLPLARATDAVTVVSGAKLRARQIETVAEALRAVPGLSVTRSGGRGGLTSLFPRGGESDFTLVLVDGIRLNTFGGGYDVGHLPVAEIERIEIVRGPQSALHGSDAIGAVVHIVTRHGGPPRAEASVDGGSFGTARLAVSGSGSARRWTWGAAAEGLTSDGFTGVAPAPGERVTNDDYWRRDASASLGWRGRDTRLRADARIAARERGFPGPYGSNPKGFFAGVDRVARGATDTRAASIGVVHAFAPAVRQRAEIAYADLDSAFASRFGESVSGTRRVAARLQTDVAWRPSIGMSLGLELQRERAHSTFITGAASTPVPVRRRVVGSFAEARLSAADRLFVTAGLRVEAIRRDALEADPFAFRPRPAFDFDSRASINPKLSVAYFLQPAAARGRGWTRLRASAGTGIRPPDAFEIAFTDNPALKPERSRSVDVGAEQAFTGGLVVIEATAFFNRYDDLIVAIGRSLKDASRFRTDNVSNARARGLELTAAARTPWGLEARASYTWLDTAILAVDRAPGQAPPPFAVGDALLRRPRHHGSIDATYARGRLTAFAEIGARGRVLDVEPSFGAFGGLFTTPGYAVVRAGAAVRVWRRAEIVGRVDNLLNRAYEETLGFPALGRSVTIGVRVAAGR